MLPQIIVLVFVLSTIQAEHDLIQHCGDFKAQQLLDIDMLLGKWYATEIIYHEREENDINTYHNECPILFLEEVTKDKNLPGHPNYMENHENYHRNNYQNHQNMDNQEDTLNWDELMEPLLKVWREQKNNEKHRYEQRMRTTTQRTNEDFDEFKKQALRRLRLIWNGEGVRSEYSLRYNESRPGFWMSFGSQSDSTHNLQFSYAPFIGTLQVLKAVNSQAVLTFCHISKKHDFFTVVVSREPWLNGTDLNHIHHMLERKQLPTRHVRTMCMEHRNASNHLRNSGILQLSFILLVLLVFRYFSINS